MSAGAQETRGVGVRDDHWREKCDGSGAKGPPSMRIPCPNCGRLVFTDGTGLIKRHSPQVHPTVVRLPADLRDALLECARIEGRPVAEVIRQALREYLEIKP